MKLFFYFFCFSALSLSFGADKKVDCAHQVASRGKMIGSGRDHDLLPQYQEVMKLLTGADGVLTKLGISFPDHVMHFLPGNEINCLVANNRHGLAHWHDGSQIVHSLSQGTGVLEFVCPSGCPMRSFYKDTLPFEQQISIILHVAGHYHFGTHTRFYQKREVDIFAESYQLNAYLEELYRTHDPDEVSEWYQYLLSLDMAQDLSRGTWQSPDEFDAKKAAEQIEKRDWRREGENLKFPKSPSPSILSAFVANLPSTLPEWKRELARRHERINRYISGAVVTKIINEGFATIMQELAVEHIAPYNSVKHGLEYMHLHQGVTSRTDFHNPYWFGRELYRSVRDRFNRRPEVQGLAPIERDRRFIEHVTREMIGQKDNYDSILFALDGAWLHKHKVALLRKADWNEQDYNLPPPPPTEDPIAQHIVVSKDPERVIRHIAKDVAENDYRFPKALVIDLNDAKTGHVLLGFGDEYGKNIPLDRFSTVSTLLVWSRIMSKPMELRTVKSSTWEPKVNQWSQLDLFGGGTTRIMPPWWDPWEPEKEKIEITPIKVIVYPDGKVEVLEEYGEKQEIDGKTFIVPAFRKNEVLTKQYQARLEAFIADIDLGKQENPTHWSGSQLQTMSKMVAAISNSVPAGLLTHSPTSAGSIHHFHAYLNSRMVKIFEAIMNGKKKVTRTKKGIAIKALPTIPSLQFDSKVRKLVMKDVKPAGVDNLRVNYQSPFDPDDGGGVGTGIDNPPGGHVWGPDEPEGDGSGDGDEEGESGDEPGDQPGGHEPGYDPNDPSWVLISDDLYAEFLAEKIKLPRLRPKSGESPLFDRQRDGAVSRRDGESVFAQIVKRAIKRGTAETSEEEEGDVSRSEILRRGFKRLKADDWRVKDYEKDPQPDINAFVTFLLDGSGSMGGLRLKTAKKFFYDLKVILEKSYPKVVFRFVTFDTEAIIHDDAEKFFSMELLGGTSYAEGFRNAIKAQEDFPRAKWDRFVVGVGDMEDFLGEELQSAFRQMADQSEYVGMVRTSQSNWPGLEGLWAYFVEQSQSDEYIGALDLAPNMTYAPKDFKKLFKNPVD